MDLAGISELVRLSVTAGAHQQEAARQLDLIRVDPNRWNIGIQLFIHAPVENDILRFFALSLLRDYLSNFTLARNSCDPQTRAYIRNTIYQYLRGILMNKQYYNTQTYILNNIISILTVSLKCDFPEFWPNAFEDLLQLPREFDLAGADVVVKILNELEIEVVMFNEQRSAEELQHNTLIKDKMRDSNIVQEIVQFLNTIVQRFLDNPQLLFTENTAVTRNTGGIFGNGNIQSNSWTVNTHSRELALRALQSLAEMTSWIDIQLILTNTLPIIMRAIDDLPNIAGGSSNTPSRSQMSSSEILLEIRTSALTVILEIAKKGMDPVKKIEILHLTNIIPLLIDKSRIVNQRYLHHDAQNTNNTSIRTSTRYNQDFNSISAVDETDVHVNYLLQYALTMNMITSEVLGCWSKFEDIFIINNNNNNNANKSSNNIASSYYTSTNEELLQRLPTVYHLLTSFLLPEMIDLLQHPITSIAICTFTSIQKLLAILRTQKIHASSILQFTSSPSMMQMSSERCYFFAEQYVDQLLLAIYWQSMYPEDFDFVALYEEESDEMSLFESKQEVRKLFTSVCRLYPERCLQLLMISFQQLPQPLSRAPFQSIETSLRLLHAFAESVLTNTNPNNILNNTSAYLDQEKEAQFMQLITALNQTDVSHHSHSEVQVLYIEIAMRYIKKYNTNESTTSPSIISIEQIIALCQAIVSHLQTLLQSSSSNKSNYQQQLKSKFTRTLLKLCEALQDRIVQLVSLLVPNIIGILVKNSEIVWENLSISLRSTPNNKQPRIPLPANAEIDLVETLSFIASYNQHYYQSSSFNYHLAEEQARIHLLSQITEFVISQLNQLLQLSAGSSGASNVAIDGTSMPLIQALRANEEEAVAFIVQKIALMSAVIKHIPKIKQAKDLNNTELPPHTQQQTMLLAEQRQVHLQVIEGSCQVISQLFLTPHQQQQHTVDVISIISKLRMKLMAKAVTFFHHIMEKTGVLALPSIYQFILLFVDNQGMEIDDWQILDGIIQTLSQAIVLFDVSHTSTTTSNIVQDTSEVLLVQQMIMHCFPLLYQKIAAYVQKLESAAPSPASAAGSTIEAPHIEQERVNIQKSFLSLLQVMVKHLDLAVIFSPVSNSTSSSTSTSSCRFTIEMLLQELLSSMKGYSLFTNKLVALKSRSIPQRRLALNLFQTLCFSSAYNTANYPHDLSMIARHCFEVFLPLTLVMFGYPKSSSSTVEILRQQYQQMIPEIQAVQLSKEDAMTQSVIVDASSFFYSLATLSGNPTTYSNPSMYPVSLTLLQYLLERFPTCPSNAADAGRQEDQVNHACHFYFRSLLTQLQWSVEMIDMFLGTFFHPDYRSNSSTAGSNASIGVNGGNSAVVKASTNLGSYRDKFRQFIRERFTL